MSTSELFRKAAELDRAYIANNQPQVPPLELVATFVRMARRLNQLKKEALADLARVSLTTVERVERGEKVSTESLDRIAQALGQEPGAFTAPRIRSSYEKIAAQTTEMLGYLEPVSVRRLQTQPQVQALVRCQAYLVHRPDIGNAYDAQVSELVEWLDFAAFVRGSKAEPGDEPVRLRDVYAGILDAVSRLEQRGVTVLAGSIDTPHPQLPEWKVAVISLTSKLSDPGAIKRRMMFVDRRCLSLNLPPAFADHGSEVVQKDLNDERA